MNRAALGRQAMARKDLACLSLVARDAEAVAHAGKVGRPARGGNSARVSRESPRVGGGTARCCSRPRAAAYVILMALRFPVSLKCGSVPKVQSSLRVWSSCRAVNESNLVSSAFAIRSEPHENLLCDLGTRVLP